MTEAIKKLAESSGREWFIITKLDGTIRSLTYRPAVADTDEKLHHCIDITHVEKLQKALKVMIEVNEGMREALMYYADRHNWGETRLDSREWYHIESTDRGHRAKAALAKADSLIRGVCE
jgi:hypothetical protein